MITIYNERDHINYTTQKSSPSLFKSSPPDFSSKAKEKEKDFNGNEPTCDLQNDLHDQAAASKMFDEQAASETLLLLSSARESHCQRYLTAI